MSRLDDELRNALRRQDAPPGFAERVLARAAAEPAKRGWFDWLAWPHLRWVTAVAAMVMVVAGVTWERERRMRAEGELAKQRLMLALRITASKLQFVKEKLNAMDTEQH